MNANGTGERRLLAERRVVARLVARRQHDRLRRRRRRRQRDLHRRRRRQGRRPADREHGHRRRQPDLVARLVDDRVLEQPRRRRRHLRDAGRRQRRARARERRLDGRLARLAPLASTRVSSGAPMNEQLAELRLRLGEVSDLRSALALLEWDQMVMMPPAGAAVRAERLAHRSSGSRTSGSSTSGSASSSRSSRELEASLPYDSDDASLIRVTRRDWEKARRVPADLAARADEDGLRGHGGVGRRPGRERLRRVPTLARPAARAEARVHRVLRAGRRSVRRPPRRLRAGHDDGRGAGGLRPAQGGARAADRRRRPTRAAASATARSRRTASARSESPR